MSETLAFRHRLDAGPATVWAALTTPAALTRWLNEHADVDLDAGRFAFWGRFGPDPEPGRQQLLAADPPRLLRFAWPLGDAGTEVTIELEPDGDGTLIAVAHAGVPPRRPADAAVRDWWLLALDNLASLVEGRELVPRVDLVTLASGDVRVETGIDADPATVFAALVEPAELDRWIGEGADVEPRVGGRYDLGWGNGPTRILDLVPGERLAYGWTYEDEPDTVVTWELEGSGGRTRLTLVHSGFGPVRRNADYELGWSAFVSSLKRMVELGGAWRPVERLEHARE